MSQNGNDIYYNNGKVGIGDAFSTHALDVAGKIGLNDRQVHYLPNQTDFEGTLYLRDGGASLSYSINNTRSYNPAMGIGALYANTTGNANTARGTRCLKTTPQGRI